MTKNVKAIDKIIAELSMQCYLAARRKTVGRVKNYTLSQECLDAIDLKHDYQNGAITEEEYKAWCLRWNLIHQ